MILNSNLSTNLPNVIINKYMNIEHERFYIIKHIQHNFTWLEILIKAFHLIGFWIIWYYYIHTALHTINMCWKDVNKTAESTLNPITWNEYKICIYT